MRFHEVRTYLPRIELALLTAGTLSARSLPAHAGPAPAAIKHQVAAERADDLIARFRATLKPGAVQGGVFNRAIFDVLLAQPGASQLRVYHAMYADGRPTFVLYAADASGQDFDDAPGNRAGPPPDDPQVPAAPGFATALAATNHLVTREHAEAIIERFASTAPATAVQAHTFDRSLIDALLAQPGAAGLRINYGTRADGSEALVLYAIDANGRELAGLVGISDAVR